MTASNRRFIKDIVLWTIIVLLFGVIVYVNLSYQTLSKTIKIFFYLASMALIVFCSSFTAHGKRLFAFIAQAKNELLKVVWPSKDETLKVTLLVSLLVVVASLILWLIDFCLMKVIGLFT